MAALFLAILLAQDKAKAPADWKTWGDVPFGYQQLIVLGEESRPDRVSSAKGNLNKAIEREKRLKTSRVDKRAKEPFQVVKGRVFFPSAKIRTEHLQDAKSEIDKAQAILAAYEDGLVMCIPQLRLRGVKIGDIGEFPVAVNVDTVIDDDEVMITTYDRAATVWVTGVDTSKMVDDKLIGFPVPIWVEKTRQYDTAIGGMRTVYDAKALSLSAAEKAFSLYRDRNKPRDDADEP